MTERVKNAFDRIRNVQKPGIARDFRFSAAGFFVLVVFFGLGLALQAMAGGGLLFAEGSSLLPRLAAGVIAAGMLAALVPLWGLLVGLILLIWVGATVALEGDYGILLGLASLGLLLSPTVQLAHHWEKALVLRLGRFRKVRGPGLFLILPLADRVIRFVDTRIRATDFSAEKTITMDTVPVHVDALAFWMVWDARKAILEVENYVEAVVLSAQTALRDAIGKHELSALLSERERLGREIQEVLDRKTNPWGITILSIEITDTIVPKELEDAMSKRAQAERERQSRVILGTAEVEIAEKFVEAAHIYQEDPTALHLRAMNMIYEGIRKNGTIVLVPSSGLSSMSLGSMVDDLARGNLLKPGAGREADGSEAGGSAGCTGHKAGNPAGTRGPEQQGGNVQ